MMRLKSDLVDLLDAALDQRLDQVSADWDERVALGVVLAAGGYPESYSSGDSISGLPDSVSENSKVFHAGTAEKNNEIVTQGGRVLCAVGLGADIKAAQDTAYELTHSISWDKVYYRDDIGFKAL
jgi:phosphoribosylamine--glycine ligase